MLIFVLKKIAKKKTKYNFHFCVYLLLHLLHSHLFIHVVIFLIDIA